MARPEADQGRVLADLAPPMIWRSGTDGDLTFVDARWLAYTGRAPGDELGRGWLAGLHAEDRDAYLARHLAAVEGRLELHAQLRLRRSDGEYRWIVIRGGRLNPAWTQTLGWSAEELLSRPSIDLVHPDDREATLEGRGRLREGGTLGPLRNRYLCKDGSHRWFEWRSNSRPERGLVYASARDITEQIAAEQRLAESKQRELQMHRQLLLADRMASVGTLAAGVAHEINNPLAWVTANVGLILEELQRHGEGATDADPPARRDRNTAPSAPHHIASADQSPLGSSTLVDQFVHQWPLQPGLPPPPRVAAEATRE